MQTGVFSFKVSVDFGVARNVAFIITQHVGGEKILGVTARAAAHADDDQINALGNFGGNLVRYNFHFHGNGARLLIGQRSFVHFECFLSSFAHGLKSAKPGALVGDKTHMTHHWNPLIGNGFDKPQAGTTVDGICSVA